MSNIVKASVVFCYKGETLSPSITIELDEYLQASNTNTLPDLYPMIAKANNHDLYSYEFEMMQAENIIFSEASGMVAEFIKDGFLDIETFVSAWKKAEVLQKLAVIAKNKLLIDNLSDEPNIKQALLDAYELGLLRDAH
ncbi:hypothetical protein MNBD_GAMMA07-2298 [hydrothermal vent metagenome]|uniref:Uncharacterized protein n=1 Tax=hydrothermal vent metagenome TaxID=652676 RepID=A0A3B0XKZ5_9ZZZZ